MYPLNISGYISDDVVYTIQTGSLDSSKKTRKTVSKKVKTAQHADRGTRAQRRAKKTRNDTEMVFWCTCRETICGEQSAMRICHRAKTYSVHKIQLND